MGMARFSGWEPEWLSRELIEILAFTMLGLSALGAVLAIPYALLPRLRRNARKTADSTTLDVLAVDRSFARIKENFAEVQAAVIRETSSLDSAFSNLQSDIGNQERQLQKIKLELGKALRELEEYRALASMTREQQDVFLRILSRQKYQEYFVGFILGLVGSILVEAAAELLKAGKM